ncbi:MAG: 16S rRNA (adenine(1518)-N(6)/adenine(1519)-N(6))-dimethyltransferase RsmA, partial [Clostridia bacterium]|nr:16S rRNA (adenine(1518)-N(6)/adenine(1519)-N(6))-dimethyltransferase RsmA [Clostridia bacterium]
VVPKKSLGQNFLTDEEVLSDIVSAAELSPDTCVLEIGPGMGVLTRELAKVAETVVCVELDTDILPVLGKNISEFQNVTVVNEDILKVDLDALFDKHFGDRPVKVIANLPYYITTPIIMKLLENKRISDIVVMIQKEVAERLAAKEGTKDFGAISLAVQYRSEPRLVRHVPPTAFCPAPKVWSSFIRLCRLAKPPVTVKDEGHFFRLIKAAFGQRRKTFLNSVGNFPGISATKEDVRAVLEQLGIPETVRGEALSMEEFAKISDLLCKK